jgi:hypothetical protein
LWDGLFITNNPSQIQLIIAHHSKIEMRKAYINRTLEVNLHDLVGKPSSEPFKVNVVNAYDGSILN